MTIKISKPPSSKQIKKPTETYTFNLSSNLAGPPHFLQVLRSVRKSFLATWVILITIFLNQCIRNLRKLDEKPESFLIVVLDCSCKQVWAGVMSLVWFVFFALTFYSVFLGTKSLMQLFGCSNLMLFQSAFRINISVYRNLTLVTTSLFSAKNAILLLTLRVTKQKMSP